MIDVKVLVVEDEVPLANVIKSYVERDGFFCIVTHTGPDGVEAARVEHPSIIVLDVMLPGFNGIEACRLIRQFSDAYIIMLTARDEEADKILGLSMGADDYVTKPFSPRELMARIQALLRRPRMGTQVSALVQVGGLRIDPEAHTVELEGTLLDVTPTEFTLLHTLMTKPRSAFTRLQLSQAIWGTGWFGDEHAIDVHVAHLRSKLQDDANEPRFIRTVRGIGYGMGPG